MNADRWNEKYSDKDFGYGDAPNAFLLSQRSFLVGLDNVFVPADGQGRNGVWIAGLGLTVRSIDLSQVAVDDALKRADDRGLIIDAWQGDLEDMDWPAHHWDCIVSIWLHLPTDLRQEIHAGFWGSLNPGGLLILEAYRPEHVEFREKFGSKGGPPSGELMFTEDMLRTDFPDADFEFFENQDLFLDEGTGHQGRSATIQARIRKPL